MRRSVAVILAALVASATPAMAQQGAGAAPPAAHDQQALAQKLANPISDLVSVPFQFNWEQNVVPDEQTRFVLNVQPVMPFVGHSQVGHSQMVTAEVE